MAVLMLFGSIAVDLVGSRASRNQRAASSVSRYCTREPELLKCPAQNQRTRKVGGGVEECNKRSDHGCLTVTRCSSLDGF